MARNLSRRLFVATAASAAIAAASHVTWIASTGAVPASRTEPPSVATAAAPESPGLIETEGWMLTADDLETLPVDGDWIVETQ